MFATKRFGENSTMTENDYKTSEGKVKMANTCSKATLRVLKERLLVDTILVFYY